MDLDRQAYLTKKTLARRAIWATALGRDVPEPCLSMVSSRVLYYATVGNCRRFSTHLDEEATRKLQMPADGDVGVDKTKQT